VILPDIVDRWKALRFPKGEVSGDDRQLRVKPGSAISPDAVTPLILVALIKVYGNPTTVSQIFPEGSKFQSVNSGCLGFLGKLRARAAAVGKTWQGD